MLTITIQQVLAHVLGDFVLQSDWMAHEKSKRTFVALIHVAFYVLPFWLWLDPTPDALAMIAGTHFLIDRFRLARFICFASNFLSPPRSKVEVGMTNSPQGSIHIQQTTWRITRWWQPWRECSITGYSGNNKEFTAVWLFMIVDGLLHVICNAAALSFLHSPTFTGFAWLASR